MTLDFPLIFEDIKKQVKHIEQKYGLVNPEIKFSAGSNLGDGFLGVTTAISLKDSKQELKIFLKVASTDEAFRASMETRSVFLQEIVFYDKVYPTLSQFYGDKTGESLKFTPELYHTCAGEMNEMIFMENLRGSGFKLHEKGTVMSGELLAAVIKMYAKFHATSFALRHQKPDVFESLTEKLPNLFSVLYDKCDLSAIFCGSVRDAINCLDAGEEADVITKIKNAGDKTYALLRQERIAPPEYSAIIHGDCWSNNMMFKFKVSTCTKLNNLCNLTKAHLPLHFSCKSGKNIIYIIINHHRVTTSIIIL